MRKTIKSPTPQLSILKEINIDLDMTGRHYALLASCEGQLPEDVVLSILKDLVEEDANKLTLSELRYLFMLVKINSLENKYVISVECTHNKKDGGICGHKNKYEVFLSDADLNPTPADYEVPTILFKTTDSEKEYKVLPPPMSMESQLYNYFLTVKNATPQDIADSKELSFEFTFMRSLMHLVDNEGNRFVTENTGFDNLMSYLDYNKYQTITHLCEKVLEVNSFGVQNKVYELECEECGGSLVFQLPLLAGLLD